MRALEGAIPDVAASRIITDVMAPNFRQNNYYQGISQALDKVFTLIEDANFRRRRKSVQKPIFFTTRRKPFWDEPWVAVLFIGFVITMMLRELMGRKSAPLAGLAVGGLAAFIMQSLFAGIVIALIVVVIAMCIPTAVLEAAPDAPPKCTVPIDVTAVNAAAEMTDSEASADSAEAVLAAAWAAEPVQAEAVTQPAAARAEAG